jgi:hypothetical protein
MGKPLTPGYAALQINRELSDIVRVLPQYVRLGYSGQVHELQAVAGMGALRAINLGRLHHDSPSIRIEASNEVCDQAGYFQDYIFRGQGKQPMPVEYAKASDLHDCPIPLENLVMVIRTLRNAYIDSLQPRATINDFPVGPALPSSPETAAA